MMTLAEIRERVEKIQASTDDAEAAHTMEDRLHQDVLAYLAEVGPAELGEMARLALTTQKIDFERWRA